MSMATLVRDAARSTPDKDALLDGQHRYTFGELERFSTAFAASLYPLGVRRGDRVAFCSSKSAPVAVAILGCLKAGAAYVPLDRKLPKDRLLPILDEVAPRAVVASRSHYDSFAAGLRAATSLVDEEHLPERFRHPVGDAPLPEVGPEDVAYCIYTSGSTGRPKGVLIQHGSVDAFYRALAEVMPIDAGSRCMNTSELCFDVHVMDLFFPLHRGATVHVTRGPHVANKLLGLLEAERITHFTAVGPVMTMMTTGSAFATVRLPYLKRVMTGAEIVNVDTMQKWLRQVPGLTLVNGYGPTEATVICTAYLIDKLEPGRTEFYPIGKPMLGTEVLLQDGELLVAGPQVMKGYWSDEAQTNARIAVIGGKRYYRTGDVCRWRPDGNLDYVGRNDDEIKLSGFRINLNEIKRVMDATRDVKEGHPVVTIHPALGKVIAACFTSAEGKGDQLFGPLQSVFKHELPYYMVPSLYFAFDRFPTLASGKTDKKEILQRVNQCIVEADAGTTRFVCAAGAP